MLVDIYSLSEVNGMTEENLKDVLIHLENEDIDWDEVNVDTVVDAILLHTQTTDIELKELYMEQGLKEIIREKYISETSLEALAKRCIDEKHLYLDIGDVDGRSKMTRAFSMYTIKLLLERDKKDVFLANELYDLLRKETLLYLNLEQDYRTYTEDMGWVNSVLYGIEAINEMIDHTRLDYKYHTELFQALLNKMFTFKVIYENDEEEQVLDGIQKLMAKGFDENKLIDFFSRVPGFLEVQRSKVDQQKYWNLYKNCKNLLQGMYIRIDSENKYPRLLIEVKDCLGKINVNKKG